MDARPSKLLSTSTSSENGAAGGSSASGHNDDKVLIRWSAPSATAAAHAAGSGSSARASGCDSMCNRKAGIVTAITMTVLALCLAVGLSLGLGFQQREQAVKTVGEVEAQVSLGMVLSTVAGLPPAAVITALRCDIAGATGSSVSQVQLSGLTFRDGTSASAPAPSTSRTTAWTLWNDPAAACSTNVPGVRLLQHSDSYIRERRLAPSARDIVSVDMSLAYPAQRVQQVLSQPSTGTPDVLLGLGVQRDISVAYPARFMATLRALRRAPALLVDPVLSPGTSQGSNGYMVLTTDAVAQALQFGVQSVTVNLTHSLDSKASDSGSSSAARRDKQQSSATPTPTPTGSPGSSSAKPSGTGTGMPVPSSSSSRQPAAPSSSSSSSKQPVAPSASVSSSAPAIPSVSPSSSKSSGPSSTKNPSTPSAQPSTSASSIPVPSSTASSSASGAAGPVLWEQDMLLRVNAMRSSAGLPPLTLCRRLTTAAQGYADDMARTNTFSHTGVDGSTPASRVDASGYAWVAVAENIAKGQRDVPSVMAAWQGSSGHYANIVGRAYTHVGFGMTAAGGPYWVQNFGAGGDCGGLGADGGEDGVAVPDLGRPKPAGYRGRSGRASGRTNGVSWLFSWWEAVQA